MKIKKGVNLLGVRPETTVGMMIAASILPKYGQELVITSCIDGKHKRSSAHASGRAFDCRIWNLGQKELKAAEALQEALGYEFDVIRESDHFHIEFDPKTTPNL